MVETPDPPLEHRTQFLHKHNTCYIHYKPQQTFLNRTRA